MISRKNSGRLFGLFLAVMYAGLIAITVHRFWSSLNFALICLVFIGFGVGFYFGGIWYIVERPAELDKKFPTSGKALRKRKKEFFDWLDSQGRH